MSSKNRRIARDPEASGAMSRAGGAGNRAKHTMAHIASPADASSAMGSTIKTGNDHSTLPSRQQRGRMPATPTTQPPPATISTTPRSQTAVGGAGPAALDLRSNDNQFHVIATFIITKYEVALNSGATSITVTTQDKQQLDRMVLSRDNFVEAVRYRLKSSNTTGSSGMPIHAVTRKCQALGLHRERYENMLYVAPGTVVPINTPDPMELQAELEQMQNAIIQTTTEDNDTDDETPKSLARQQLLAELREASNLMADSVTPEAAQFWRKHVVELQSRLRALHEQTTGKNTPTTTPTTARVTTGGDAAEEIMRRNERLLASLHENTGYVAPSQDEFRQFREEQQQTPAAAAAAGAAYATHTTSSTYTQQRQQSRSQPQSNNLDPDLQGLPMVDVVSPADLPGGYEFEAEIEDRRFLATVPAGGVRKGETFSCYMRDLDNVGSEIPVGRWRDGQLDCLTHGVFHPLVLNAVFCPAIALAQIMTRMSFDFMGRPAKNLPRQGIWSTWGMVITILCFWVFLNIVVLLGFFLKSSTNVGVEPGDVAALVVVNVAMLAYVVYAAAATRGSIREKYLIREYKFIDLEDCLCATFCLPCTICQMGRHTASFGDHEGVCWNDTGLPDGVPSVVV